MGNTITKTADNARAKNATTIPDDRFGNTILANTIKEIMKGQTTTYNGQPLKVHLAKACCANVIRPDVSGTDVISIAFPRWVESEQCKITSTNPTPGKCLSTTYVGFQIPEERIPYCGESDDKPPGLSGKYLKYDSNPKPLETDRTTCDNFMSDMCARNLFEQGCTKIGPNGKIGTDRKPVMVPQFSTIVDNPMCWTDISDGGAKFSYGPPECACLNSIFGPNLNTWPSKSLSTDPKTMTIRPDNPYGLTSSLYFDDLNDHTVYSLNIFKNAPTMLYPKALDNRCQAASFTATTGRGKAYLTAVEKQDRSLNVCLNQINIADSNITNANLSDITQSNNCGQPPSAATTTSSIPVNLTQAAATNDAAADTELKRLADEKEAAVKKIAEDQLKAQENAAREAAAIATTPTPSTSEPSTSTPSTSEPSTSTPSISTPSPSTPSPSTPSISTPSTSTPSTSTPSGSTMDNDDDEEVEDDEENTSESLSAPATQSSDFFAILTDQQKMIMIGAVVVLVLLIIILIVKK